MFLPARLHGIPLVMLLDYEHGAMPRFLCRWPALVLVPHGMPEEAFICRGVRPEVLRKYLGLKEEIYVYDLEPDPVRMQNISFDLKQPIVLIRPSASMAHYHVKQSDDLFLEVIRHFQVRSEEAAGSIPIPLVWHPACRSWRVLKKWMSNISNKPCWLLHSGKKGLKGAMAASAESACEVAKSRAAATPTVLAPEDRVRVRSRAEIQATLDECNRLKGVGVV